MTMPPFPRFWQYAPDRTNWRRAIIAVIALVAGASASLAAPRNVDVLVLNFDPLVPGFGGQRLHSVIGWQNPATLAAQYEQAVFDASGGEINYNVVQWRDLDQIPTKVDGFAYTPTEYVQKWQQGGPWHSPDTSDYSLIMANQNVAPLIDDGTIDEVWMFGAPYFGFWESAMAGPRSFTINGGVYADVPSSKPFAIMGFSYERSVVEMLHNLGHRTEASVARAFGGWNIVNPQSDWDRFTANVAQTTQGPYGIGSIHYPANGAADYDYGNPRVVESTAPDWLNYPETTGATAQVSAATWGGNEEGYLKYWFEHMPRVDGINSTSLRQNNWWNYVFDVDGYDASGWPRGMPRPGPNGHYYLFVDQPNTLWQEALDESAAQRFGGYQGHLITITSQAEMTYAVELAQGEFWIAGSDAAQEGTWRWVAGPEEGDVFYANGAPIGFSAWYPGAPNDGSSGNVMHMLFGNAWNDVGPTYPNNRGYIVEFSVIPGDFDIDGDVDGEDFLVWQRDPAAGSLSDWKANFGVNAFTASAAVPEPGSAALLVCFAAIITCRRTRCGCDIGSGA